ncbi:LysR family transcriptional regulator [Nocardia sp. NPDC055321]
MLERPELEAFLTLTEELHFGRTADRMHVSTGRVSQIIRKLERRVGAPLFERNSRGVALTPLGLRMHEEVLPAAGNCAPPCTTPAPGPGASNPARNHPSSGPAPAITGALTPQARDGILRTAIAPHRSRTGERPWPPSSASGTSRFRSPTSPAASPGTGTCCA